jgi:hypothetical protein
MAKRSTARADFKGWFRSLEIGVILAGVFITISTTHIHW